MSGDYSCPSSSPFASASEKENVDQLANLLKASPRGQELVNNLPLYMRRQVVMRQMFMMDLYREILNTHGVIMEFGCRWGTNLATFTAMRGILEPYNHNRTILGFDTFEGLKGVNVEKDRSGDLAREGAYGTSESYEDHLSSVLSSLEAESPIPHIKKHHLIKGDVKETLPKYLEDNPQTVVALAFLDMDIYEPTKAVLETLWPYLTKGSVVVFDEMNWKELPGPTIALKEHVGLSRYQIKRSPLQPIPGYIVID